MSNLVVQTNVLALNSHRNLKNIGILQSKASERLSSGYRINRAADDAAGLAISESMRAQIRGLDQASRNTQDGISMIQTAEGGLNEVVNMIQRVRELTVQAANDTNTTSDRAKLRLEINELTSEIRDTAGRLEFNTKKLLDTHNANVTQNSNISGNVFQIGPNAGHLLTVAVTINLNSIANSLDVEIWSFASSASEISKGLISIDAQLTVVLDARAKLGSYQNRLEYTMKSLDTSSENLSAAESRIRDADMAKEMMRLTSANVLQQAGVSMLAQANQSPQSILMLLR